MEISYPEAKQIKIAFHIMIWYTIISNAIQIKENVFVDFIFEYM